MAKALRGRPKPAAFLDTRIPLVNETRYEIILGILSRITTRGFWIKRKISRAIETASAYNWIREPA